jgi:hypothetical protein
MHIGTNSCDFVQNSSDSRLRQCLLGGGGRLHLITLRQLV